jgi:hypothetical protein
MENCPVCFDLRSFFRQSPSLKFCPLCCTALHEREVPTSAAGVLFRAQASIPIVDTRLYTCPGCGWWAVRESRGDCELNDGLGDFLLVPGLIDAQGGLPEPPGNSSAAWQTALNDLAAWQDVHPLSKTLALLLFSVSRQS